MVAEDVTAERIEQAMRSAGGKLLESVRLFDVYRGQGIEAGKKSMAFALSYRAADRTLTAEEVQARSRQGSCARCSGRWAASCALEICNAACMSNPILFEYSLTSMRICA